MPYGLKIIMPNTPFTRQLARATDLVQMCAQPPVAPPEARGVGRARAGAFEVSVLRDEDDPEDDDHLLWLDLKIFLEDGQEVVSDFWAVFAPFSRATPQSECEAFCLEVAQELQRRLGPVVSRKDVPESEYVQQTLADASQAAEMTLRSRKRAQNARAYAEHFGMREPENAYNPGGKDPDVVVRCYVVSRHDRDEYPELTGVEEVRLVDTRVILINDRNEDIGFNVA